MKTTEQIRSELTESDYLQVLEVTKNFLLDYGLGKSGDYDVWKSALVSVQSILSERLRPYLLDMVVSARQQELED
ncbi:hypothetical protein LEP3755_05210 [Leptolyngbya sp. NIES-3755]|nr:hypothetical protein LEP3755_05210 [Leptolyngbya sp. NIES-3755]